MNARDEGLEHFTRSELVAQVKKLHAAIRQHRDRTGQELCCQHPPLWELLPRKIHPNVFAYLASRLAALMTVDEPTADVAKEHCP